MWFNKKMGSGRNETLGVLLSFWDLNFLFVKWGWWWPPCFLLGKTGRKSTPSAEYLLTATINWSHSCLTNERPKQSYNVPQATRLRQGRTCEILLVLETSLSLPIQITCETNKCEQQEMEEIPLTAVAEIFKLCRILSSSTVSNATTIKSDDIWFC